MARNPELDSTKLPCGNTKLGTSAPYRPKSGLFVLEKGNGISLDTRIHFDVLL